MTKPGSVVKLKQPYDNEHNIFQPMTVIGQYTEIDVKMIICSYFTGDRLLLGEFASHELEKIE